MKLGLISLIMFLMILVLSCNEKRTKEDKQFTATETALVAYQIPEWFAVEK